MYNYVFILCREKIPIHTSKNIRFLLWNARPDIFYNVNTPTI